MHFPVSLPKTQRGGRLRLKPRLVEIGPAGLQVGVDIQ